MADEHGTQTESVVHALHGRLGGGVDVTVITAEVEAEFATYSDTRVRQFIPLLVESCVWERLRQQHATNERILEAQHERDRAPERR